MSTRKRARAAAPEPAAANVELKLPAGEADDLRSDLSAMWRQGKLCDVRIVVGTRTFEAHCVVLAAHSPYFAALVGDNFAEGQGQGHVTLQELDEPVFESVLEFVYARKCTFGETLLQPLLEAATRLQIDPLRKAAELAIIDRLTPSNCLDAWNVATHLDLTPLTVAAKKTALAAFDEVAADGSPAFSSLPASRLDELLADDELKVDTEETAFKALERWVDAQPSPPAEEVTSGLLSRIRFPLIESKGVRLSIEGSALVQRSPMVLVTAYREHFDKEDTPRTRKRKSMVPQTLAWDELEVGMRVRVMSDEAFVMAECHKRVPGAASKAGWPSGPTGLGLKRSMIGGTYEICVVDEYRRAVWLRVNGPGQIGINPPPFYFPYTVLLRAE